MCSRSTSLSSSRRSGFPSSARRTSAPVALILPLEYLGLAAGDHVPAPAHEPPPAPPADPEALQAAVDLLRSSKRPVILAGRGAVSAGARDAIVSLADATGALLATSLRGNGLFYGHPYNVGVAGAFSTGTVISLLCQADCVVSFGASLNIFTRMGGFIFFDAMIVQCDVDPAAFHGYTRATVNVAGDAREVAERMLSELGDVTPTRELRDAADEAGIGPEVLKQPFEDASRDGALDPRAVCRRLDALLPAERTVVIDGGQVCAWPVEHITFTDPDSFLWMLDFGSLGGGLGAAVGAALARPERRTMLIVGDGALFMSLGDLDLVARERTPVVIACLNDRAYGSELQHMAEWDLPFDTAATFDDSADLAPIAQALGCEAETITQLDQIDALADRVRSLDGPLFLDIRITQDVLPSPARENS